MSEKVSRLYVQGYGDVPTLIHMEPLPEVEPEPVPWSEDRNPRRMPIHHKPGTDPADHDCGARIIGHCHQCSQEHVLCTASCAEIRALLRGGWRCGDCEGDTK